MRKIASLVLAAAAFTFAPAANAAVATTGPDFGPDGSFTIGFSGSNVAQPSFSESFSFATTMSGLLSAIITTTGGGPSAVNDVDFTRVFLSGTGLGDGVDLTEVAGSNDVNEIRAVNDIAVGAGVYSLTTQGTAVGSNGSYGGSISFRATPAVPEPATWAMMLIGFAAIGVSMRRRQPVLLRQAA